MIIKLLYVLVPIIAHTYCCIIGKGAILGRASSARAHPWLVKRSTSILIGHTGYINKKDSFGHGEFDSMMAKVATSIATGMKSAVCL